MTTMPDHARPDCVPRIVFLDLDDTLLNGNSGSMFVKFLLKRGEIGWYEAARALYYVFGYKLNVIDFEQVSAKLVADYRGMREDALVDQCLEWFDEMVKHRFYDEALALLEEHRQAGDRLVLLTASTVYAAKPIAEHLGVDKYIATRLEVDNGVFTGRFDGPLCFGGGKVHWARRYLADAGLEHALGSAAFYTDSITDLPMLEVVQDPQVVNPDPLLAREAKRRGWPVRRFVR